MLRVGFVSIVLFLSLFPASRSAKAQSVLFENAFPSLPGLDRPVDLQRTPSEPGTLFVVEQGGVILSLDEASGGAVRDTLADLRDVVNTEPSWEEGLLGLAFHPDYATNRHLFVYYNAFPLAEGGPHRSIISRFTVTGTPARIDRASELVLFDLVQPLQWHNGGQLAFHPLEDESNLYISLGDGGGGGDPLEWAQDRTALHGSILRVNVDTATGDLPYGIPADNPFVGNTEGWREEIWAYGLRNPWRFSIDPATGWLWVGDVGQFFREEVSVIAEGGANLGWDVKEGPFCFDDPDPGEPLCSDPRLTDPIWWYPHDNGNGSVTGGRVYHGSAMPDLVGRYIYADFLTGRIWALDTESPNGPFNTEIADGFQIATFGLDANDELYAASFNGRIYRLVPQPVATDNAATVGATRLTLAGPNPVRSRTTLAAEMGAPGQAHVAVYDVLGREVSVLWEGVLNAGTHPVHWTVDGVAAGLYVVRMKAGASVSSVRLVVTR